MGGCCGFLAQIHDGFPVGLMDKHAQREAYLIRFDGRTRQPKRNYYDAYYSSLAQIGASTFRMGFAYPMPDNAVGDMFAVCYTRPRCMHAVHAALFRAHALHLDHLRC
jgi:hypothetical protein